MVITVAKFVINCSCKLWKPDNRKIMDLFSRTFMLCVFCEYVFLEEG
jgi:hypothetical protein